MFDNFEATTWIAFVSVIASLLMAIATFITIWLNSRRWKKEDRARVIFCVELNGDFYSLKVHNVGKSPAYNINFKVNQEIYNLIPLDTIKQSLDYFKTSNLHLQPNQFRLIPLYPRHPWVSFGINSMGGTGDKHKKLLEVLIDTKMTISGRYNKKIKINESFTMKEWINYSIAPVSHELSAMVNIADNLSHIKADIKTISKSLKAEVPGEKTK